MVAMVTIDGQLLDNNNLSKFGGNFKGCTFFPVECCGIQTVHTYIRTSKAKNSGNTVITLYILYTGKF